MSAATLAQPPQRQQQQQQHALCHGERPVKNTSRDSILPCRSIPPSASELHAERRHARHPPRAVAGLCGLRSARATVARQRVGALQEHRRGAQSLLEEPCPGLGWWTPLAQAGLRLPPKALPIPLVLGLARKPLHAARGPCPVPAATLLPLSRARAVGHQRDGCALRVPLVLCGALMPLDAAGGARPLHTTALPPCG